MTHELRLLKEHRSDPRAPTGEERTAARLALDHAMRRETPGTLRADTPALRRGLRGARRRLGIAALATFMVLLGTAAVLLPLGSTTTGPALAAPAVLERLARVAAAQSDERPGPGQYLYTASHAFTSSDIGLPGGVSCEIEFLQYRRNWVAANGEGLFTESNGPPIYSSPGDAARCRSLPKSATKVSGISHTWAAPGCLSIDPIPLGALPTNPAVLRARLLTGKVEGGPPGPAEAFAQVGDLLRETDAPPRLRAALYRAAAGLPGVKFLGNVTDKLGRTGLGLALDGHGTRHELIFSAGTSALLAEQGVLVGHAPGVKAKLGTVLYWSAYSGGHVTNSLPASSPLPLTPSCLKSAGTSKAVPGRPQDSVLVGFR